MYPLCWPWPCCASNCTLLAALPCFFRSRYVRAATPSLLSISQARKWFPSLWSLKSKSPVISTWLSKESALPGLFVDFSVAWGELPPPRYGCRRLLAHKLHCRAKSNFRFVPVTQTQRPCTSRRPSLVVFNHALLKNFVEATAITSETVTSKTHVALFCPSWKREPFLVFVFGVWSRRMFIWPQWCTWSSGFRRKVATAPSFLVAKPRFPVAKCDYAHGFFEPWLWYCT